MKKVLQQRVAQIKKICDEQCLQASDIANIVAAAGANFSMPTYYKLLSENAEAQDYYPNTIITIYEAIVAKYGECQEIEDSNARGEIIERDKTIDRLVKEYGAREQQLYADRKNVYENTIDILKEQIAFKDEEIRRQAALIEKLINKVVE